MKYAHCRSWFTIIFVAALFLAFGETSETQAQRRGRRAGSHSASQKTFYSAKPEQKSVSMARLTPQEAAQQLAELCATLKDDAKSLTAQDVQQSKQAVLRETEKLIHLMKSDSNRQAASIWLERFQLQNLANALRSETGETVQKAATATWQALHSDQAGVRWTVFDGLRLALRRYFRFEALSAQTGEGEAAKTRYEAEFTRICGSLPGVLEEYAKNVIDRQDSELTQAVEFFEDVSVVEPKAAKLAELAKRAFSGVNLSVQVGAEFLSAGFQRDIVEPVTISETIMETRVSGSGTMAAVSFANPVSAKRQAKILLEVDAQMESITTGRQHPVTLHTKTTGSLHGVKAICISEDGITTGRASTRSNLRANIYSIRVDAGPIVTCIAKKVVQQKQGEAKAAASRRAENRMNERLDKQVDTLVAALNKRYQEKLRGPLLKAGLFPRVFDLSSTSQSLNWNALIASSSQPSAMNSVPRPTDKPYGLFVRVHQSALNNVASIALAGKYIDEDVVVKKLQEQFAALAENKPAALNRPEGEDPLRVTFGPEGPVRVSFADDKITVLIQIHEFFLPRRDDDVADTEGGPALQARRGLSISLTYEIKMEDVPCEDGVTRKVVVLERVGEPKLSPRPGDGDRFSAQSNATRTVVNRRLQSMEKRIVGQPRELGGEWAGKGVLIPTYASAQDGWLTFGWDWEAATASETNSEPSI